MGTELRREIIYEILKHDIFSIPMIIGALKQKKIECRYIEVYKFIKKFERHNDITVFCDKKRPYFYQHSAILNSSIDVRYKISKQIYGKMKSLLIIAQKRKIRSNKSKNKILNQLRKRGIKANWIIFCEINKYKRMKKELDLIRKIVNIMEMEKSDIPTPNWEKFLIKNKDRFPKEFSYLRYKLNGFL